jgi:multicomponent Na+:H+ antiporter subunit F
MIDVAVDIGLFMLALSIVACMYRVVKGPSLPDRVVALDTMGVNFIGVTALLSIRLDTQAFVDVILLIGILTFIGTVAISKFLEKGVIIDRNRY